MGRERKEGKEGESGKGNEWKGRGGERLLLPYQL